jgi:chlorobactene glucosyltransferase
MILQTIVMGYWIALFCLLLIMSSLLVINLLTFPRLQEICEELGSTLPALSILVPARNEEHCIEACTRSLVAQSYQRLEVIILDDGSTDATGAIVQRIIDKMPPAQNGRLRLVQGSALPEGWVGKNFACHQLAQHARGDYLLFTDADTVHAPGTAKAVIACMQQLGVKLLTAQPEFALGSIGECLVVPLLNFTIMTLLPVALVLTRPEPHLSTGNGQLLCFHRSAYEKVGGHASVKGNILEDVLLARAVKASGDRIAFVDALEFVRCRMYRSFAGVWSGFTKNLFALYNYSLPFALSALLLNLALFIVPPLLAIVALLLRLSPTVVALGILAYALVVLMRVLLTVRFTRREQGLPLLLFLCLVCLLHPLSIGLECLILLNSIRCYYRKSGVSWKGRYYKRQNDS